MKEIKFLLTSLGGAAYASTWWLVLTINIKFIPLAVIISLLLAIMAGIYIVNRWSD